MSWQELINLHIYVYIYVLLIQPKGNVNKWPVVSSLAKLLLPIHSTDTFIEYDLILFEELSLILHG